MASRDSLVVRRGVLALAELQQIEAVPKAAHIQTEFGELGRISSARLLDSVAQMDPVAPAAVTKRFELGRRCFAVWVDGGVAAYGWVTRGPEWVTEFERELRVEEGEAYIWDCATLPPYRRQGLFSALVGAVIGQLRQEGLRRLWIIGLSLVPAIKRGVEAAGFQPVMSLTYARLLNKRALLAAAQPGASREQVQAARRLLRGETELAYGPLIVGNTSRPRPPETHFDR